MNTKKMIGKTREQVINLLGKNYISDLGGILWTYETGKTLFGRKKFLIIEFDHDNEEGIVIGIEKLVNRF